MAWTDYDPTKPDGANQTGPNFGTSANKNDLALWVYAVISGFVKGFAFSKTNGTGTTEEPQYYLWTYTGGQIIVRSTNTWTGTAGQKDLTGMAIEYSSNGGGAYDAVVTMTFTFDGTTNAPTASTNGGGIGILWAGMVGKLKKLVASFATHTAAGVGAHGITSLALQAASAVAITGGTVDGTDVGVTATGHVNGKTFKGLVIDLGQTITGSTAINWSSGDTFFCKVTGTGAAFTFSNLPASGRSQGITLEIDWNGITATNPWPAGIKWPNSTAPSRSTGKDVYEFSCRDGSTILGYQANRAFG